MQHQPIFSKQSQPGKQTNGNLFVCSFEFFQNQPNEPSFFYTFNYYLAVLDSNYFPFYPSMQHSVSSHIYCLDSNQKINSKPSQHIKNPQTLFYNVQDYNLEETQSCIFQNQQNVNNNTDSDPQSNSSQAEQNKQKNNENAQSLRYIYVHEGILDSKDDLTNLQQKINQHFPILIRSQENSNIQIIHSTIFSTEDAIVEPFSTLDSPAISENQDSFFQVVLDPCSKQSFQDLEAIGSLSYSHNQLNEGFLDQHKQYLSKQDQISQVEMENSQNSSSLFLFEICQCDDSSCQNKGVRRCSITMSIWQKQKGFKTINFTECIWNNKIRSTQNQQPLQQNAFNYEDEDSASEWLQKQVEKLRIHDYSKTVEAKVKQN